MSKLNDFYEYNLLGEIEYDGILATAIVKIVRSDKVCVNLEDIQKHVEELVNSLMENNFKISYDIYNAQGLIRHLKGDEYEIGWGIKNFATEAKLLKEMCSGCDVQITSGNLENEFGKFIVKEEEAVLINRVECKGERYRADNCEFKFVHKIDQLVYDGIVIKV